MIARPILVRALLAAALLLGLAAQAPARPRTGSVVQDCRDCPQLVVIPAGSTLVGAGDAEHGREHAPPEMVARETPIHRVAIARPLAVGRYEVTRGEFAAFVAATGRDMAGCTVMAAAGKGYVLDPAKSFRDPSYAQTDRHPVVCVNWNDATAYAAWLSQKTGHRYRLPSEAEWEYAARAGTTTARWWGDGREDACRYANLQALDGRNGQVSDPDHYFQCHDGYANTAPVGSFKPNPFGLYDIQGNAWEWTLDCYDGDVQRAGADGAAYTGGPCPAHMDRGASWQNTPKYVRSAARHKDVTEQRNLILGFRVVRELD